ncbi:MAG: glycosyltransferase family 8 protein [Verrucomicrobiales bacterium]|jgi:lipopolysaccharide biosynthesis glycosyltransferase|nr:glycosyltransferase family 8 protein [Verrucomicrobiales bacterium]
MVAHSDVALVTDKNYLLGLRVAIRSLLGHAGRPRPRVWVVCDESVNARERRRLESLDAAVRVVAVTNAHRQRLHTTAHYSHAMYLKFDLPTLLPELDQVLYLDADVLVTGDLSELWGLALGDDYAAAVEERGMGAKLTRYTRERLRLAGRYVNSGVLLLNLAALRRDDLPRRLAAFTAARPWLSMPDQDAFNVLLAGRLRYLAPEFNYMTMYLDQPGYALPAATVKIVHYADWRKPWRAATVPRGAEWRQWLTRREWLRLLPGWLVPLLFYDKHSRLDEVSRTFKLLGAPLYTKWKNQTDWEARVLGLRVAGTRKMSLP